MSRLLIPPDVCHPSRLQPVASWAPVGFCGKSGPSGVTEIQKLVSLLNTAKESSQSSAEKPGEQSRLAAHLGEQACRLQQGHGVQGGQLSAGLLQQRLGAGLDDILEAI